MPSYSIRPKFQISIYPFLPGNTASASTRLPWLNGNEITASQSKIDIPPSMISSLSYSDALESSDFRFVIPKGVGAILRTGDGKDVRLGEILDEGTIIEIFENEKSVFCGYVINVTDSGNIDASDSMVISGIGLEGAIQQQSIFVDFSGREGDVSSSAGQVSDSPASRLATSLNALAGVVAAMNSPSLAVQKLMQAATNLLLSNGKFGGKQFSSMLDISAGLSMNPADAYTNNFIHVVNFINMAKFGNTINFWSMADTFAKKPLYELFVHRNAHHDCYVSDSKTIAKTQWNQNPALGYLVYRKTPLKYLGSVAVPSGLKVDVPANVFSRYQLTSTLNDVITGVHVGIGILDTVANLIMNKVTYTPYLLEKFGQRILPITLDGVSFPPTDQGRPPPDFLATLASIQNLVHEVFGKGDRIVRGTFTGTYFRGISKGQIMNIKPASSNSPYPRGLSRYDREFYVTGIDVDSNPSEGIASMNVSVQWGRRSARTLGVAADSDIPIVSVV